MFHPEWVFNLWIDGIADEIVANDPDLSMSPIKRLLWRVRGQLLQWLFGWWWIANESPQRRKTE